MHEMIYIPEANTEVISSTSFVKIELVSSYYGSSHVKLFLPNFVPHQANQFKVPLTHFFSIRPKDFVVKMLLLVLIPLKIITQSSSTPFLVDPLLPWFSHFASTV